MKTKESKYNKPDYSGDIQVSAWKKKDKNGKTYLSVKIDSYVNLFRFDKKE